MKRMINGIMIKHNNEPVTRSKFRSEMSLQKQSTKSFHKYLGKIYKNHNFTLAFTAAWFRNPL